MPSERQNDLSNTEGIDINNKKSTNNVRIDSSGVDLEQHVIETYGGGQNPNMVVNTANQIQ